jgi:hypothetical protein
MEPLVGKGMWIWQIEHCCDGDLDQIAAKAGRAGLSHVLIKVADGTQRYGMPQARELSLLLKAHGVEPIGWTYSRGAMASSEADLLSSIVSDVGFDRLVIDAEQEYQGHPGYAIALMDALREKLGKADSSQADQVQVGLSSYYLPNNHPSFPWGEFAQRVDFWMPQVYWYNRAPDWAVKQSLAQAKQWFPVSVVPTLAAYPEAMKSVDRFQQAVAEVKAQGLKAVNFWSWQHCPGEVWTLIRDLQLE